MCFHLLRTDSSNSWPSTPSSTQVRFSSNRTYPGYALFLSAKTRTNLSSLATPFPSYHSYRAAHAHTPQQARNTSLIFRDATFHPKNKVFHFTDNSKSSLTAIDVTMKSFPSVLLAQSKQTDTKKKTKHPTIFPFLLTRTVDGGRLNCFHLDLTPKMRNLHVRHAVFSSLSIARW